MKNISFLRRGLLVASSLLLSLSFTQTASASSGTHGGYYWSYYKVGGGSADEQLLPGGQYGLTWSGVGNVVFGKGWAVGSPRNIGYNLGVWTPNNTGFATFGAYGWRYSDPAHALVEYYVVDNWGGNRIRSDSNPDDPTYYKGFIDVDGARYDIYLHKQVNKDSVEGKKTFWQFFSARQTKRALDQNNTIHLGAHFTKWAQLNMNASLRYGYLILASEAGSGNSGSANATVWQTQ